MYIMHFSSEVKNMSKSCIWIRKEFSFSFHILAVKAFRTIYAWDFLFTSKFFWFVLCNAKVSLTSSGLRRLFDGGSEVKQNLLGTKSPPSIQWIWSTTQVKLYSLAVSLLLSYLRRRTLYLILNLLNVPSVTSLVWLFRQLKYCLSSGRIASPWGFNIKVHSGNSPPPKIRGFISTSLTCSTTLGIISPPTFLFYRTANRNRVEPFVFLGGHTEAQTNLYFASTSVIKTITIEEKPLKLKCCFMVCPPLLGHYTGRCEPSTCLELSRRIRISGKSF